MDDDMEMYLNSDMDFQWCIDIWDEDSYNEDVSEDLR